MAFITIAGQNQIAKKQGENATLNITQFVLANVPNLGSEPATRIEIVPNANVVDQLAVTKSGYVNTNQVVYSLVMGSNIGDYQFNWVGLVDDEGVLIAVVYIPLTSKTKSEGGVPGNTFTRNFLISYAGIQQATAITVPAETWQIDFSARLNGIDERERLANLDIYGHEGFLGDGWKVTGSAGAYSVAAGVGYVGGVRAKNIAPQEITTATFPNEIWLNVSLQGDISDMTAVCEFVIDTGPFADYVDGNGIEHYLTKIADIDASGGVVDVRSLFNLRDANNLNTGTVPLDRLTDPVFILDANILTKTFFYLTGSTWVGSPLEGDDGNNQGYLIHINWAGAYAAQFFFNINGTWQKKTRRKDAGVWSKWATDYSSENLADAPEIKGLQSYVGGTVISAGSATFTSANNNVHLIGVGVGVEIGDVVTFGGSALNAIEYTVSVITDNDNIVVNQGHAGKASTHALSNETVNVTATLLCKYYLAPPGLGQSWVEFSVPSERDPASTFINSTNRLIKLSIYMLASEGNAEIEVGTNRPAVSANNSTETLQVDVPKGASYRILGTTTVYRWSECI